MKAQLKSHFLSQRVATATTALCVTLLNLSFFQCAEAKTSVYFSPLGGCETQVVQLLDSSRKTADIAVYSLNNPPIVQAIHNANKRGVSVRVLTDRTQAFGHGNREATESLAALTAAFRVHSKNRIMHNKFVIVDGRSVLTGSFNWTRSAEQANEENCLITDDKTVVDGFQARFSGHLWIVNSAEKSMATLEKHGVHAAKRRLASEMK